MSCGCLCACVNFSLSWLGEQHASFTTFSVVGLDAALSSNVLKSCTIWQLCEINSDWLAYFFVNSRIFISFVIVGSSYQLYGIWTLTCRYLTLKINNKWPHLSGYVGSMISGQSLLSSTTNQSFFFSSIISMTIIFSSFVSFSVSSDPDDVLRS